VSMAQTRAGERRPGELRRRVVLVSESQGLAAMLEHLLGNGGTLTQFASLGEAVGRDGFAHANTVVLDLPHGDVGGALAEVRGRYRGELIMLAERRPLGHGVAPDPDWVLLERPFSAMALAATLGLQPADARPAPTPEADADPPPPTAPAPQPRPAPADSRAAAERVAALLAALVQGWRARRRVRVAGFSAFALAAFTVAFALAAQGRCGPGCDAFGTGFSPAPTIAPRDSVVPSTTGPKRVTTTTVIRVGPAVTAATGAFAGASGGRATATTAAERRATVTTRAPSPGGGPRPTTPTTRPVTTTQTTTPTTSPTTTTIVPTTTVVGQP
jgi:hypothetical protein